MGKERDAFANRVDEWRRQTGGLAVAWRRWRALSVAGRAGRGGRAGGAGQPVPGHGWAVREPGPVRLPPAPQGLIPGNRPAHGAAGEGRPPAEWRGRGGKWGGKRAGGWSGVRRAGSVSAGFDRCHGGRPVDPGPPGAGVRVGMEVRGSGT